VNSDYPYEPVPKSQFLPCLFHSLIVIICSQFLSVPKVITLSDLHCSLNFFQKIQTRQKIISSSNCFSFGRLVVKKEISFLISDNPDAMKKNFQLKLLYCFSSCGYGSCKDRIILFHFRKSRRD
jgi:hypothetical protein